MALYEGYASTLASGYGYALQPGAVQSSGVASPLWALVLTAGALLDIDVTSLAKLFGLLLSTVALVLLPGVSMGLSGRHRLALLDFFPAAMVASSSVLSRSLVSGDETALFILMLVLTLRQFLREEHRFAARLGRPRDLLSLLPAVLLLGCRPEAALLLLVLFCWRLIARLTAWRLPLSSLAWLLLLPLCFGLTLAASYLLFAEIWPGIITARGALPELRPGTSRAAELAWHELNDAWNAWGGSVPLLVVAAIGAIRPINYWGRTALVAMAGANLAAMLTFTGVDVGRLALPMLLALLILAAAGLGAIRQRLWPGRPSQLRLLGGAALTLGLAGPILVNSSNMLGEGVLSPLDGDRAMMEELRAVVSELGWKPRTITVLTSTPGSAAHHGFSVLDASGLTDPAIRRYSGNRRPLELQQLIFRDRRPDIIIERGPWKAVHNLQRYPEARRLYFPIKLASRPRARVSLARRLVLEYEPWPDVNLRIPLGKGLELLGVRVEPGYLVFLFTINRKVPTPTKLFLTLGGKWSTDVPFWPKVYPPGLWRPGELVRQRIPIPPHLAAADIHLELGFNELRAVHGVDLRPLSQQYDQWLAARIKKHISQGDWDLPEVISSLTRRPMRQKDQMSARLLTRIKELLTQEQIKAAGRQMEVMRQAYREHPGLEAVSRELAAESYQLALGHIHNSQWTSAFELLRAAARADPASPWIARRLEEARRRMPAESHLVEELELELARRALVLAPSAKNLERVMGAHLVLGQHQMVISAAHTWKQRLSPSRTSQYLLAKALGKLGRLDNARELVSDLLIPSDAAKISRRCPSALYPKLLLLQSELFERLGIGKLAEAPKGRFLGRGHQVGPNSELIAYCANWQPGKPLQVNLYIWQRKPEELHLNLSVGSRLDQLVLSKSSQNVRLVRRSFYLPPASYPVRIQGDGMAPLAMGTIKVGPEISFGFELAGYPGWKRTGTAFGSTPSVGRSFRARKLFGYVGERFADSYHQASDRPTGALLSPPFKLRLSHLMVLVAGGNSKKLGVDLLVEGKRKHTVRAGRSETLQLVTLPIGRYWGKWARVLIRDRERGRWGHIAVDEIRQIDGPIPGVAP